MGNVARSSGGVARGAVRTFAWILAFALMWIFLVGGAIEWVHGALQALPMLLASAIAFTFAATAGGLTTWLVMRFTGAPRRIWLVPVALTVIFTLAFGVTLVEVVRVSAEVAPVPAFEEVARASGFRPAVLDAVLVWIVQSGELAASALGSYAASRVAGCALSNKRINTDSAPRQA